MEDKIKNPPANVGDPGLGKPWVGKIDPLEKGMATHFIILVWAIQGTEEPGGLWSMEVKMKWTWLSDLT